MLVLATACGGGEGPEAQESPEEQGVAAVGNSSDGDTDGDDGADDEPAPDEEPTQAEPSDDPEPTAAEEAGCSLPGRWRLRSDEFLAQLPAPAGGSVEHVDGPYEMVLGDDGSVTMERDAWSLRTSVPEGAMRVTISDLQTGTWSASDGVLSIDTTTESSDVELALETDGGLQPIPGGTYEGAEADPMSGSGAYTCSETQLEVTIDGYVSTFDRVD